MRLVHLPSRSPPPPRYASIRRNVGQERQEHERRGHHVSRALDDAATPSAAAAKPSGTAPTSPRKGAPAASSPTRTGAQAAAIADSSAAGNPACSSYGPVGGEADDGHVASRPSLPSHEVVGLSAPRLSAARAASSHATPAVTTSGMRTRARAHDEERGRFATALMSSTSEHEHERGQGSTKALRQQQREPGDGCHECLCRRDDRERPPTRIGAACRLRAVTAACNGARGWQAAGAVTDGGRGRRSGDQAQPPPFMPTRRFFERAAGRRA